MMMSSEEILLRINEYIDHMPWQRKPYSLYEPIKYVLAIGGKRIRPTLMMLSYNLYKDNPESILNTAVALETYHNYTLLHDDLMDQAPLRRGHETVHVKWDANTAILSGDSMLVLAFKMMAQTDAEKLQPVIDLFTETALEIGEGQQYDMEFETRTDVTEDEYIEMIRLKTSVLLACAMKIGAILGGASEDDAANLYKFGEQIGLAFQLQDDFLDVYGNPETFGKRIGGDILSNKKTFMLINAMAKSNTAQCKQLLDWLTATDYVEEEKVAAVTKLYNEIEVDKMAEEKIDFYYKEGMKFLDKVCVDEERKEELKRYTRNMMKRIC